MPKVRDVRRESYSVSPAPEQLGWDTRTNIVGISDTRKFKQLGHHSQSQSKLYMPPLQGALNQLRSNKPINQAPPPRSTNRRSQNQSLGLRNN